MFIAMAKEQIKEIFDHQPLQWSSLCLFDDCRLHDKLEDHDTNAETIQIHKHSFEIQSH
jgi:hypothetical protein